MDMKELNLFKIISLNLLIIALFDSYTVYSEFVFLKVAIYLLKLLNVVGIMYLLRYNTRSNYQWLLLVVPIFYLYLSKDIVLSIQLFYSAFLPVCCFILLPDEYKHQVALNYVRVFCFLCLIGIPIYILINLRLLPSIFTFAKGEKIYYNYLLVYWGRENLLYRFTSIFDEPGVVGTLVPMIYFYFHKELKLWQKITLNIAGFLSLSMFYFITIIPVLFFSDLRAISMKKSIKRLIVFILCLISFYFLLNVVALWSKSNPVLALAVYHRFEWAGNWIVGIVNNRDVAIQGFDELFDKWNNYRSFTYYFGYGKDYMMEVFDGSTLSYRTVLIEKGTLIVFYLLLCFSLMHQSKYKLFNLISIVFLMTVFFQRPTLHAINYFLLLYVGLRLYVGSDEKYGLKELDSSDQKPL
ncbi:hypothetical protein HCX49_17585 [Sphingobacterium kitahiroshimense]|uniref:hypothetical protein n=1 Tax=Sphingobacterium sp. B16(2022) TaxID=2914044 RepID=UPI00143B06A0|nr:hypothetical protein [Sphingobacterium sp. B16(2022)]NJI75017.1 hypothetical protein [Sphingobacterium sp. B16(2022)]